MAKYVLTGANHSATLPDGTVSFYTKGDEVELTNAQFEAFKDKFTTVTPAVVQEPATVQEQAPAPADTKTTTKS